jgi:UDP-N-acetylglucosamine 2-epimerase
LKSDAATSLRFAETFADIVSAKAAGKKIVLVTTHRRESFGEPLRETLSALRDLSKRSDVQVVFPVHRNPAVIEAVRDVLGENPKGVTLLEPLDYVPFVWMMDQASLILTDSGGIQEEAPSLGKPVLILREKTERPEAVEAGTAKLVGTAKEKILQEAFHLLDSEQARAQMTASKNPFGDGKATKRILDALSKPTP